MSRSLTPLIISNTFEDWLITTNDIIDVLEDVVTIGDAEVNAGNVKIDGNISSTGSIFADTFDANSISALRLNFLKPFTISHDNDTGIILNRADPGTNEGAIGINYTFEGVTKWQLASNATHDTFSIANGPIGYSLQLADNETGTGGILIGNNVEISNTILPSQLSGNAASATTWANATTVQFSGDISGTFDIQGGEIGPISVSIEVADDSHTHDGRYYTEQESDGRYLPIAGKATKSAGGIRIPVGQSYEWGPVGAAKDDPANVLLTTDTSNFTIETDKDFKIFLKQKNFTISSQLSNASVINILALNHQSGNLDVRGDVTAKADLSDRRKKENIERIENALDKVKALSGYTFNYIGLDERMTGVMSDEVKEVLPEVVYETEKNGETVEAVRYGNMMGLIIEAIKELSKEIEDIKRG